MPISPGQRTARALSVGPPAGMVYTARMAGQPAQDPASLFLTQ
jgi:hypothetical protein